MDYEELLRLLKALQRCSSLINVADELYWSPSKVSKIIRKYEDLLEFTIYSKTSKNLLTDNGLNLLNDIEPLVNKLDSFINKATDNLRDVIAIDENIIASIKREKSFWEDNIIIVGNAFDIIEKYKEGYATHLICSSDFEYLFNYNNKNLFINKEVYKIYSQIDNPKVYAYSRGCSIRMKMDKLGISYTEIINHSTAVQTLVNQNQGIGYVFDISSIEDYVHYDIVEELTVEYNIYSR